MIDSDSFIGRAQIAHSASTATPNDDMKIIYCAVARSFYQRAKTEIDQFAIILTARERELSRVANGGPK